MSFNMSKSGKKIITGVGAGIFLIVVYFVYLFFVPNISPKTDKATYLLIPENASYGDVMSQLNNKADILSTFSFNQAAKLMQFNALKSGRYKIEKGMGNFRLIRNLMNGRQTPVSLTFNNIRTKEQLAGRLAEQLMPDSVRILNMLNDSAFLTNYNLNPTTSIVVFLPNTYEILWNVTEQILFERMNKEFTKFWNDSRKQKAAAIPLTPVQVCTLASIVDEETNAKNEKAIVAGLYINRMNHKMPLQADPTVKFALGDFTIKRILFGHLKTDSPYNTYKYLGLPPGPIRIPALTTIDAVLNYYKSDYLYMCAKETLNGEHNFAATWAEHKINAEKYQKALNERGIN